MLIGNAYKRWLKMMEIQNKMLSDYRHDHPNKKITKYINTGSPPEQAISFAGETIGGKKVTDKEALAVSMIRHKRAGADIPLPEAEIIRKLKVRPTRVRAILKVVRKAEDFDY